MNTDIWMQYFTTYGPIAIFVVVFLEYLNLPGFPAGVIMPLAGMFAARGEINFAAAIAITVAAGLAGSLVLYALGRSGGDIFLKKYYKRFPKHRELIEEKMTFLREKGGVGIFVSKLIPMVRTLVSIPAGVIRMDLTRYIVSSTLGITVWNLIFVGGGYFFGETLL